MLLRHPKAGIPQAGVPQVGITGRVSLSRNPQARNASESGCHGDLLFPAVAGQHQSVLNSGVQDVGTRPLPT